MTDRVAAQDPAVKSREFWGQIFTSRQQEG